MIKSRLVPSCSLLFRALTLAALASIAVASSSFAQDTTTNRNATADDALAWPNSVNEGDFLIFKGNVEPYGPNGEFLSIYGTLNTKMDIRLAVGKKICIYRGTYRRILLDGINCASTEAQPTIITNFGGQVQWGNNPSVDGDRSLELKNFKHVYLTGEYNLASKTGDPGYLGHNNGAAMGSGNYYEKYGFWGNQRWSAERQPVTSSNGVRIYNFDTCKVRYVGVWGGGFAGFNIKTNNPTVPSRVSIDVQDCFAGFLEGEGFYISDSGGAENQNLTRLTMRNNIVVCSGAEALQTDNLVEGSIIENNVVVGSARFFRRPFHSAPGKVKGDQEGLHQFSFVEGGITVRNNIMAGGVGGMQTIRFRDPKTNADGTPRAFPAADKPITITNNYIGQGRSHASYVFPGDGITPYILSDNVYSYLSNPVSNDAYLSPDEPRGAIVIDDIVNRIFILNNRFSRERCPYSRKLAGNSLTTASGNVNMEPPLLKFKNLGFADDFDLRRITIWSAQYGNETNKAGIYIPYKKDDLVFYWDSTGATRFFKCKIDHQSSAAVTFDPNTATTQWQLLTWSGRPLPPLDVRFKANTYYNQRGMGLTYNEPNTLPADTQAPVVSLIGGDMNVPKQKTFVEPGYSAADDLEGNVTGQVLVSWIGPTLNSNILGEYYRKYSIADAAGNLSEPVIRTVTVSGMSVNQERKVQINIHRSETNTLAGWTNLGNNTIGLLNWDPTWTNMIDVKGVDTGWDLLIEDNGPSFHNGIATNTGVTVSDFPPFVTRQGLKFRESTDRMSIFRLSGLNPAKFYDIRYTGILAANVQAGIDIREPVSGRTDSISIFGSSTQVGELRSLKPSSTGALDLTFSTRTPGAEPSISGVIVQEKNDSGYTNPISEWRLDEGTGTVATDSMGLSNGTLAGNATWTTAGKYNRAIALDGADDWISVPSRSTYSGTGFSVSMWVKPALIDNQIRGLISKRLAAGNQVAFSIYTGAAGALFMDIGKTGGSDQYNLNYAFPTANVWYHVVVVFDASLTDGRLKLYVNGGAPKTSATAVQGIVPSNTSPLYIGTLDSSSGASYQGVIDQVKIFNKALNQSNVELLGSY